MGVCVGTWAWVAGGMSLMGVCVGTWAWVGGWMGGWGNVIDGRVCRNVGMGGLVDAWFRECVLVCGWVCAGMCVRVGGGVGWMGVGGNVCGMFTAPRWQTSYKRFPRHVRTSILKENGTRVAVFDLRVILFLDQIYVFL